MKEFDEIILTKYQQQILQSIRPSIVRNAMKDMEESYVPEVFFLINYFLFQNYSF